jgi:uncharacterized protein (DUF362 family)
MLFKKSSPGVVYSSEFNSWDINVPPLLDATGLGTHISATPLILIKPNLVEAVGPPITTPPGIIGSLIDFIRQHAPKSRIIIGEGTGSLSYDTYHAFDELGYTRLATEKDVELLDLNTENLRKRKKEECKRWPEMYLPTILDEAFLISVPVLKAHSLAKVTLTMKNMMGCAPPSHYQGNGSWGKSTFHDRMHESIFDLNQYRIPDFTLLDATIGMAKAHLWGPHCDPPINTIAASWDPVAIDSFGTSLLGWNWQDIGHIRMAHNVLGIAEPLNIQKV